MGHHEKEHETKLTVKRPLMVADLIEYRGFQFLVAFLYESHYTIAQVIAPVHEFAKEGVSIADKLAEIVQVNCELSKLIAFDLYTCSDVLISETLASTHILGQKKTQQECNECKRAMDSEYVRVCLDDLYINKFETDPKETKEHARDEVKQERSVREGFRCTFEMLRKKVASFINRLKV
ncbi:hypothetical protein [Bacillus cereus]|uniref:hypothetical protein n=1 Tax=Bacillus cereus group TaxID=86661 RepID=UPI0001A00D30|nr:hypothetical protein [Bacillus cereus]EEK76880.1 hypothetical protein bcere0009_42020 [Bacillus cereus R309803]HDR4560934.1 hypothetical protein [Bacillus luti]HDR4564095.1 hypothetical protein [Bacillus luti]